jgi:hypothetical protein
LETLDFVTFFRDNYLVVAEADCFLLVRANDSNADGMINLSDFMKMLLPSRYSTFQNVKAARKHHVYAARPKKLSHDIEFGVAMILQR